MEEIQIESFYYIQRYEYKNSISLNELILNELNNNNDWNFIFLDYELDEKSLEYFKDKINWKTYTSYRNHISISVLEKFADYINWNNVCRLYVLPKEILEKFKDKLNWKILYESNKVPEDYIP